MGETTTNIASVSTEPSSEPEILGAGALDIDGLLKKYLTENNLAPLKPTGGLPGAGENKSDAISHIMSGVGMQKEQENLSVLL